jgi:hypothetical protein
MVSGLFVTVDLVLEKFTICYEGINLFAQTIPMFIGG